jgi:hypothetical protein
MFAQ